MQSLHCISTQSLVRKGGVLSSTAMNGSPAKACFLHSYLSRVNHTKRTIIKFTTTLACKAARPVQYPD